MIDISLDIETFASRPDAALATIGAMASDGRRFYVVVDDPEGFYDQDTIRWHMAQENAATNVGSAAEAKGLSVALALFSTWLRDFGAHREGKCRIWGHATFEFPVLHNAFLRDGARKPPWNYRNTRDLRTLYDLAGCRPEVPNAGKHDARHDAEAQLAEIAACRAAIAKRRAPQQYPMDQLAAFRCPECGSVGTAGISWDIDGAELMGSDRVLRTCSCDLDETEIRDAVRAHAADALFRARGDSVSDATFLAWTAEARP